MSKIYGENVTPTDKALLLDSTFRLEIPILAFQTLKKCISSGITNIEDQNILKLYCLLIMIAMFLLENVFNMVLTNRMKIF